MPQVRITTFPSDDLAFEAHVRLAKARVGTTDCAALLARIQLAYPLARLSVAMPEARLEPVETWYLYRDGAVRPRHDDEAWGGDPALPRAVLAPDGTYADANDAAADLFGVSRDAVIGQPAGSFTKHEPDPDLADTLLDVVRRTGRIRSTAVVLRPNGEQWPIEFVVKSLRGGSHAMTMRRIEIDAAER